MLVELTPFLTVFLICGMILITVLTVLLLIRAAIGPRMTDRIVAANMICTQVVAFVCVLAYFLNESYLVDIALLYALLNMVAVEILTRVVNVHEDGKRARKKPAVRDGNPKGEEDALHDS